MLDEFCCEFGLAYLIKGAKSLKINDGFETVRTCPVVASISLDNGIFIVNIPKSLRTFVPWMSKTG